MTARAEDAWSLYWAGGNLDSCLPAGAEDGAAHPLRAVWEALARDLPAGTRVLDLATGNGAVALAMLQANPALDITGVDRADIDPAASLPALEGLQRITFRARVDVASLPFDPASFDVVTSQFGVEYGALEEAAGEAISVVRPGGRLHFVLHHVDSAVVAPAAPLRAEIASLTEAEGPIPTLVAYVAGRTDVASLERAGERHLAAEVRRTRRVTRQVYRMVNAIVEQLGESPEEARIMAGVLAARLAAEGDRLAQLEAAALDERAARELKDLLEAQGARVLELTPLRLPVGEAGGEGRGEALVGWRLVAERVEGRDTGDAA